MRTKKLQAIFAGSSIVITGGASGIGLSMVRQLKELGANLVVIDRDGATGKRLQREMSDVTFIRADMADAKEAEIAVRKSVEALGSIDIMVNDAGIFMGGEMRDTPIENWQIVTDNNTRAVYNGTHFAYQYMLAKKSGHIVNVGSAAGLCPVPGMPIYGASKFAISGLTWALRNEAKSLGIDVSLVCPTVVDTPLYDTAIYNAFDTKKIKNRSSLQKPEVAALRIIVGMARKRATIHTSFSTRATWWVFKVSPWLYDVMARKVHKVYRSSFRKV